MGVFIAGIVANMCFIAFENSATGIIFHVCPKTDSCFLMFEM